MWWTLYVCHVFAPGYTYCAEMVETELPSRIQCVRMVRAINEAEPKFAAYCTPSTKHLKKAEPKQPPGQCVEPTDTQPNLYHNGETE